MYETLISEIKGRLPEILSLRNNKKLKSDNSYVSLGDLLVQDIVISKCAFFFPNHIVISEENVDGVFSSWDSLGNYVILDPIDGTENFVSGLREWGIGISIFTNGIHESSFIFLPELNEYLYSGQEINKFNSRIIGLSSSLSREDLLNLPQHGFEYRIFGCSMYNMMSCIKGSLFSFENVNGVNCWDILPGLNLALEHGMSCYVDDEIYKGKLLFPVKKYKVKLINS